MVTEEHKNVITVDHRSQLMKLGDWDWVRVILSSSRGQQMNNEAKVASREKKGRYINIFWRWECLIRLNKLLQLSVKLSVSQMLMEKMIYWAFMRCKS